MVFCEPRQVIIDTSPSPEIAKNEARILWREKGLGGKDFGIIAVRNNGGSEAIVHLPFMGQNIENTLASYGYTKISNRNLPLDQRELVIEATNTLGPLLGVDAVLNGHETEFDKYLQPFNGMPEAIMGVFGEPGVGKSTFLANIWAANKDFGYVTIRDADPYSPESLTEALSYLKSNGIYVDRLGRPVLESLFAQMEDFHRQARNHDWQKPQVNLKQMLSDWRNEYLGRGIKNPPTKVNGQVVNSFTLVDLPGIKTDRRGNIIEKRDLDAADLLRFGLQSMQIVRDLVNLKGQIIGPQKDNLQISDLYSMQTSANLELSKCGGLFEINIREFVWAIAGTDINLKKGLCSPEDGFGVYWQSQKSKLQ